MSYEDRELVSYRHSGGNCDPHDKRDVRFVQYADDPLPEWAVDVTPYEEVLQDEC
jgi:hypothetical protein